ncbi:hypothetical protein RvY_12374-3 [Ramazzottius varieornatus]|uniref:Uncharacterized protein n=1 Tax=Ramazzottius varieornatus TaxID=947166 RepID=A0A1D1VT17_RAMVA|nr:hypothetical protein RvY_12374-3 [Ramazzottius varieornatus]
MESRQLKQNLQQQMERLLTQLADLLQAKETMEEDDYHEQYQDTVDQLEEFGASLTRLKDDSLLDQITIMQQAIRKAISDAFAQPRQHFATVQQPQHIRQQLTERTSTHLSRLCAEVSWSSRLGTCSFPWACFGCAVWAGGCGKGTQGSGTIWNATRPYIG